MSLAHPALNNIGNKTRKVKFKNADEARRARELEQNWQDLQKKWSRVSKSKTAAPTKNWSPAKVSYRGSDSPKLESVDTGWSNCYKAPAKVYTGDKVLGIAQMSKSNAVPVFNTDHIVEIARMRR